MRERFNGFALYFHDLQKICSTHMYIYIFQSFLDLSKVFFFLPLSYVKGRFSLPYYDIKRFFSPNECFLLAINGKSNEDIASVATFSF